MTFLKGEQRRLLLAALLGSLSNIATVGLLATSAWLISRAAQQPLIGALGVAIAGVRFFALTRGIARYGERLASHDAALRLLVRLRVKIYAALEKLNVIQLNSFSRGDILTRLVDDVNVLQDLPLRVVLPYITALVAGVATIILVAAVLPSSVWILTAALICSALLVPWLNQRMVRATTAVEAGARSSLNTAVVDAVEGARDLIAFGQLEKFTNHVIAADNDLTRVARKSAFTTGLANATNISLTGVAIMAAILYGVPAVNSGALAGTWLAVVVLLPLAIFEIFSALPLAARSYERVQVSRRRVEGVLDEPSEVSTPGIVDTVDDFSIRTQDLSVTYPNQAMPAVSGFNIDVEQGKSIAIVGPSGAGKSTIAAVLLGLSSYSGSSRIGNIETSQLTDEVLRQSIGLIAQDAHIFETTLRNNLRLAAPNASDDELLAALRKVGLDSWLRKLPHGLDTHLGTDGDRMSGGIRQRVAVARALLANFPILVLDEPCEHLEADTAAALLTDLLEITENQTTVLITHDLRGLETIDEIVVLDHGTTVERGNHSELIENNGWYSKVWHSQASNHLQRVEDLTL